MARIFTDGAESGDVIVFSTAVGVTNVTTNARISGRCYRFGNGTSIRNLPSTYSEFYYRQTFFNDTRAQNNDFLSWRKGGTILGFLRLNSATGCIDIYTSTGTLAASGTFPISLNTLYVIEVHVKIADAGGVIEYTIDGANLLTYTGDTKPGTDTGIDTLGYAAGATSTYYVDDIAFNDTSGAADNSWCGDAHIYGLPVTGNGDSSQLVGSDGNSVDNYALVDEIPSNGDTDYVESATAGNKDLYTVGDLPSLPAGSTIKRVIVETRARELTADGNSINLGVKTGGTENWSTNIVVGTSYARQVNDWTLNPITSGVWTETEVNALQAGVKIV